MRSIMLEAALFNILSVAITVAILMAMLAVKQLEDWIVSRSWHWMKASLGLTLLAQMGGLVNVYLLGPGLNWLSLFNTTLRLAAIVCFSVSLFKLQTIFKNLKRLADRLKLKTPEVGKLPE